MNKAVHPQQARPALRLLCILTPTPYGQWRPVPAATRHPPPPRAPHRYPGTLGLCAAGGVVYAGGVDKNAFCIVAMRMVKVRFFSLV